MKTKLTELANKIVMVRKQQGGVISPPTVPFFPDDHLLGKYVVPTYPQPLTYKSGAHTSAMIALFLPAAYARKYALSDPGAVDPSEMHITLAYLGKADQLSGPQINEVHEFMELVSEHHPPLTGTINGCGRFCNGDDDGDPFIIIPDLPDLPNLRELIVLWLRGNEISVGQDHGFTPHITLTYIPHTDPNPFNSLERGPVSFPTISLILAGDRYDYPLNGGMETKAALITKIGARHTGAECAVIQKMHDLSRELGAECHPMSRRAGARHSHADQGMVQQIHDDCADLGATCKALPAKDDLYHSQVLKEGASTGIGTTTPSQRLDIIKAQSDAPNYKPASTPQRCKNCIFFRGDPGEDFCTRFDFTADQDYVCEDWEAQRPDEIPGYVANKGDLARLTERILILRGGVLT